MKIGGQHFVDQLKNLKLNKSDELFAIYEIRDYWAKKLPNKHIHVLVVPPASTTVIKAEYGTYEIVGRISS